jgi:eukaryotic-like serine/threonine-protein kinase
MRLPNIIKWKATGRTLGEGGQGQVMEVTDKASDGAITYALKGLSPGKPQKAYERFAREIAVIKALQHPSIIKIIDHSDPDSEFHYYVMELITDAVPLKKLIGTDKNPFFERPLETLRLFMQIAEAISAWTGRNIIHRDLSPANILLLPDTTIKVIDFGICQVDELETITLDDEGVGTPNYMAPECESGSGGKVTARSDLYSAGKITWSMITNRNAFARENPVFNSKSMNEIFPNVPESWHLHHIFEKTIRRNPVDRWEHPEEALQMARRVHFLISMGYLPLERIGDICPICGFGALQGFERSHEIFGNPNPPGIYAWQCNYCGFCFPVNTERLKVLSQRKKPE